MLRQQTFPWTHLDNCEGIGMPHQRINLSSLPRQGLSKNRMDVGTRIEITIPTDPLISGFEWPHVVAKLRVVECELHKTDEGNRTRDSNLGSDSRNKFRMSGGHKELQLDWQK